MTPSSRSSRSSPGFSDHNSVERCSTARRTSSGVASGSRASSVASPLRSGDHRLVSPYGEHAVSRTIASSARAVTMWSARRDLPQPGSPTIDTTPLWPVRTSEIVDSSRASSSRRPTNGMSHRTGREPAAVAPGDEPRLLGLLTAADLGDTERLAGDRRRAQRLGGLADQHAARRRQRLEPRCGVDDVTHRRVVGPGDRADEHLARVDADAHLDVARGVATLDVLGDQPGEGLLHAQGGAHRPVGVVLVGDGRTEQGDDGVAEDLVDTPAEGLDLDDERLEVGLDEPGDRLGVEVLGECRVADEVGEQHGDDTALLDRAA